MPGRDRSSAASPLSTRNDRGIYGAGAGLELPVSASTAFTGRAAYDNSFRRGSQHAWVYTASVDHNITDGIATQINVSFQAKNSTVYDVGVVFFF